ncbi:K+ channel inward rectifier domain-containing protein [Nostoc sp. NIES-4103]|nr:K+ channel inward rectifier domain-containing protein [Nostoc sp. NIES-4103]
MKFRFKRLSNKQRQPLIPKIHLKLRDGQFEITGMNVWYSHWRDPYHLLLTIPWIGFLALIAVLYITTNALFALVYMLGGDCIENARPGYFLDLFFFSVQTLASIGYGAMYPKTTYANIIVTIEAITGLVGIAVMTGLAFARFSRPTARVMFSRVALITIHEGVPTLMFRAANQRRNQILEAQIRVYLMRDEVTAEGHFMRRFHDLKMVRSQTPSFALTWVAIHPIDEYSPLYGMTAELLTKTNSNIVISLTGVDETVAQVVHARHSYTANEILWNYQFVDIFHHTSEGHRYVDYTRFHDILPLD